MADLRDRCPDCGDEDHHGCTPTRKPADVVTSTDAATRKFEWMTREDRGRNTIRPDDNEGDVG